MDDAIGTNLACNAVSDKETETLPPWRNGRRIGLKSECPENSKSQECQPLTIDSGKPVGAPRSADKPPKSGYGPLYRIDPNTGCWNWLRSLDDDGYGYFRSNGRIIRAHRYCYELRNGPIPDGFLPDHKCRNRACVNPDHIEGTDILGSPIRTYGDFPENPRK